MTRSKLLLAFLLMLVVAPLSVRGDEGMWLINRPPLNMLREKYGFTPDAAWLEHVQKSAVRLSDGGSASLVSPDGLVMTNHHVASGQLAKLSTEQRDIMKDGFHAKSRDQELKCPDLEADILWQIEDVTAKVNDAAAGKSPAEAAAARRGRIAEIEKESEQRTRLKAQVVTLYAGGLYHLYLYKRYTDVRLVFAPEIAIANFGGDVDNFEYPRYCLDFTFLRIYDEGKPLKSEHYLRFSNTPLKATDLVFTVGNPASTQRQLTMSHLRFMRDIEYPIRLGSIWRREVQLRNFVEFSKEQARIAMEDLGGFQNSRKALSGKYEGLLDPRIMGAKERAERELRDKVDANPDARAQWSSAWDDITKSREAFKGFYTRYLLMESRRAILMNSDLFRLARTLLRLNEERAKPDADRLSEYRDSNLASIELDLFSPAPIHEVLEIDRVASGLSQLAEILGGDDPVVLAALAGKSPRERAEAVVRGTGLKDIDFRKKLAAAGAEQIAGAGTDPMMSLAIALDAEARTLRKKYENEVEAVERQAYARIAAARFATQEGETYPDATFTLRLSVGTIVGHEENGSQIEPFTTVKGLFERAEKRAGEFGFNLPDSWKAKKDALEPATPCNFISTNDIIGGSSGSPVINRDGEAVGLIFDGNRHSLVWDVAFDQGRGRSVSVDLRVIIEALREVYDATALVEELTSSPARTSAATAPKTDGPSPETTMQTFIDAVKSGNLRAAAELCDPASLGYANINDAAEAVDRATASSADAGQKMAAQLVRDHFGKSYTTARFEKVSQADNRAVVKLWKSEKANPVNIDLSLLRGKWVIIAPSDILNAP